VPQDPLRELLDLSAVHGLYARILEERLGHPIPAHEIKTEDPSTLAITMQQWLNLLDLAITPVLVRDALKTQPQREALEALLRFYILRASQADDDRDKADFIATHLYRNPPSWLGTGVRTPGQTEDADFAADFERELILIVGESHVPPIPEERRQLVREFEFIRHEVGDIRHFEQLTDSGVVQRVRDIKHALGPSFYHPHALARVASYNAYFGRRFDELFHQAAEEIKSYAARIQQEGGSMASRVEGDVTVQHLADVAENQQKILRRDYRHAQEQFRKVAGYKKAVRAKGAAASAFSGPAVTPAAGAVPRVMAPTPSGLRTAAVQAEESKLRGVIESIQHFVRAAEANSASVVPLRNVNVPLSPVEVDAFRAEFTGEKSFRADYAASLMRMAAVFARIRSETVDYQAKRDSAYLWKPHADSMTYLVRAAQQELDKSDIVKNTAEQRGLKDKVTAMTGAQGRLRALVAETVRTLETLK
jgi:hypothetical protein